MTPDEELAEFVGQFYADPLGFVEACYPWGEPGPLKDHTGPDDWQREVLVEIGGEVARRGFNGIDPVDPIKFAASSGHGIGKTVISAWLTDWLLSTRPHSRGTVTANTFVQLQTKTWATIQTWTKRSITAHWFDVGSDRIRAKAAPESWFVSAQTCREENSEAFAGQHAADSSSWYLFDEASAIPDKIWEVAEGGLTDGEPFIFAWGNPTRNSGKFFRVVFGSERGRWITRTIDSRTCRFTNKELIRQWIEEHGEDSDFVRVRVRGLAPRAGDLQFIDNERVFAAQKREAQSFPDDPLIAGVDVPRGGADWFVVRFRRGCDARSIPPIRIPGEQLRDTMVGVSKLAEILGDTRPSHKVAFMFVDSAFGGPMVNRLHQLGFKNVGEVNFGAASLDPHQANMRAFMWQKLKDWLPMGAIDSSPILETDLTGPGFHHNQREQLVLESKEQMAKRGLASPDEGDGLALTFARNVAPVKVVRASPPMPSGAYGWMG
jgi:hypothetical protein